MHVTGFPFESKMLWINFWNIIIGTFTSFTHFRWNFAKATRPFSLRPHQLPIEWFTLRYAIRSSINYVTLSCTIFTKPPNVVYFDQCLGAAHFKCRLKYAFSSFFMQKAEKGRNYEENWGKIYQTKNNFEFAPRCLSKVLFPENISQNTQILTVG